MKEDKTLYKQIVKDVDSRLSGKRLEHVHSVSEYAPKIAKTYGVNEFDAKLAGILHDWDKLIIDDDFIARLQEFDLPIPSDVEYLYPILHATTGAEAVHQKYPQLDEDIINAIRYHTVGAVEMSDLCKVIFIADLIEPLRNAKKRPDIKQLRKAVGEVDLDELYYLTYKQVMRSLVARDRYISPATLDIWNGLVKKHRNPALFKRRQGDPNVVL